MKPDNPYAVLGTNAGDRDDAQREAYGKLASTKHPDKGGNPDDFHALATAFAKVRSPQARAATQQAAQLVGIMCRGCGGTGYTQRTRGFTGAIKATCAACVGLGYA